MDQYYLLIAVAMVAALAAAVMVVAGRRRGDDAASQMARLSQSAETMAATQSKMAGRLEQAHAALDRRMEALSKRLGEGLSQQTEKTGETLRVLHERLAVIDAAQKNLTDLSKQVVGLQDILSNKQARGAFGQFRLEDLVRDALPSSAYDFEVTLSNGKRVDCLIKLPEPAAAIAIDSKFPLEAYQALHEATDEAARKRAERSFRADLLQHVKDIADKYIVPGETADWAFMFVPSEAVHAEAHVNFHGIVEEAYRRHVAIVSPNNLMATLATSRAIIRDAAMKEQADLIQIEVIKLLTDLRLLDDRVGNLERHFAMAEKDIKEISTSTRKIARSGEKISEVRFDDEEPDDQLAPPVKRLDAP